MSTNSFLKKLNKIDVSKSKSNIAKTMDKTLTDTMNKTRKKLNNKMKKMNKTIKNSVDKTKKVVDKTKNTVNSKISDVVNKKDEMLKKSKDFDTTSLPSLSLESMKSLPSLKSITSVANEQKRKLKDVLNVDKDKDKDRDNNKDNDKDNNKEKDSKTLYDDLKNIGLLFTSLKSLVKDNDELKDKLHDILQRFPLLNTDTDTNSNSNTANNSNTNDTDNSSSSSVQSSSPPSSIQLKKDDIEDLLSFIDDSSIANLNLAYLNLRKGYLLSFLDYFEAAFKSIQEKINQVQSILQTIDNVKNEILKIKNNIQNIKHVWTYFQLMLGIFAGTITNILADTLFRAGDSIDVDHFVGVLKKMKDEEMEYFMKAFGRENNQGVRGDGQGKTNENDGKGIKLAQTLVLLLYLIHRTITDGENDIDKGIIHIEPLFRAFAKAGKKIDDNIIGPIGGEFMKRATQINALKSELKNTGILDDAENALKTSLKSSLKKKIKHHMDK